MHLDDLNESLLSSALQPNHVSASISPLFQLSMSFLWVQSKTFTTTSNTTTTSTTRLQKITTLRDIRHRLVDKKQEQETQTHTPRVPSIAVGVVRRERCNLVHRPRQDIDNDDEGFVIGADTSARSSSQRVC